MATTPDSHAGVPGFESLCCPTKVWSPNTPIPHLGFAKICVKSPSPPKGAMWDAEGRAPGMTKKPFKLCQTLACFLMSSILPRSAGDESGARSATPMSPRRRRERPREPSSSELSVLFLSNLYVKKVGKAIYVCWFLSLTRRRPRPERSLGWSRILRLRRCRGRISAGKTCKN